jgi:hypothetical protein
VIRSDKYRRQSEGAVVTSIGQTKTLANSGGCILRQGIRALAAILEGELKLLAEVYNVQTKYCGLGRQALALSSRVSSTWHVVPYNIVVLFRN